MRARFVAARRGDWRLLVVALSLTVFGLVMIRSASVNIAIDSFNDPNFYVRRQIVSFVIGIGALLVTQAINYRFWQRWATPLFFTTLALLLLVLLFPVGDNVKSWAHLFGVTFQTSEPSKLSFILFFAAWLDKRANRMQSGATFLTFLGIVGLITFLIMMQPDFGTLSVMVAIALTMYFVAGLSIGQLVAFFGLSGAAALYYISSASYRLARITSFLNPSADAEGAGYHVRNIFISVGSGFWWGLGLGNSRQKRLFLPEPHNDSIFAVTVEELGLLRSTLVVAALFYLVWSLFQLARQAPDGFARAVITGFAAWIFWQSLLNIGAMIGLLPLTGVPLPFISFGGTSLVALLAALGIVLNISKYRRR